MSLSRRSFLTGTAAIAVSAALPAVQSDAVIGWDLAVGPDKTAVTVYGSNGYWTMATPEEIFADIQALVSQMLKMQESSQNGERDVYRW